MILYIILYHIIVYYELLASNAILGEKPVLVETVSDFCIIWELGGSSRVRNTPTGSGEAVGRARIS